MSEPIAAAPRDGPGADQIRPMLIDGRHVQAQSGRSFDSLDPATGKRIARVAEGDAADIDIAVRAARRTFDEAVWTGLPADDRSRILWRASEIIEQRVDEIAQLETLDNGMPFEAARWTAIHAARQMRYFAGWCTKIHGITSEISTSQASFHAFTAMEPMGVAGLIVPWNVPFTFAAGKFAVALAAGCSCVLKPAEETPLGALLMGDILMEAGVPAGVVNVVTGFGHTAGQALVDHPMVDKIAFTGSTEVGRRIIASAAGNMKKVTLELGGKSPVIVFDDADVEAVIAGASNGIFMNAGQVCIAGSRLYVQRRLFDRVVAGIADVAGRMKVGSGFDPANEMGPLISAKQRARVFELVQSGVDEGADLVAGGRGGEGEGFFFQPTVLANPSRTSRVMREEIFGPVLSATTFDELEDVVEMANDTEFGLAAAVWTRDLSRAHLMTKRLRAGTVWVNTQLTSDMSIPFGGYKQSGWGREKGREGLDAYLQSKSVFIRL